MYVGTGFLFIPIGIICFLCGTMYCVFYTSLPKRAWVAPKEIERESQIWRVTPPQQHSQASLAPLPLSFCARVRAPRMSPAFQIHRNATIPYSKKDESFWIRVGVATLNIHDPNVDQYISGSLHQSGVWEAPIVRSIQVLLPPTGLFVDVGANIGYFSLYATLMGARVVSFEPMLYNIVQIQRTLSKNVLPKWRIYNNAVSDVTGDVVRLRTTDHIHNAGNHKIGPVGDEAYTVRLDDIIHEDVDLMKVDVEGYEAFVLAGGVQLFCQYTVKALIMEMTQDIQMSGCNVGQMLKWLECIGYEMRQLTNPRGPKIHSQGRETNVLWVLGEQKRMDCCGQY